MKSNIQSVVIKDGFTSNLSMSSPGAYNFRILNKYGDTRKATGMLKSF